MYSGGLASFFAARRAIAKYGVEGTTKPMTLRAFRERIEAEGDDWVDPFDIGGCACLEEPE